MQLSVPQIHELLAIIDKNQLAIIGTELGDEFFTAADKELLRSFGIDSSKLYRPELSSITTSFHFGMLSEALGAFQANNITYNEIKDYVKAGKYIPQTQVTIDTLNSIKAQSFADLKKMGGSIFADVNNILADKTLKTQTEFIAGELKEGINRGLSVSQISHEIATKTGDWWRNFDRIIETSSQTAFEAGRALEIERRNPNRDPIVYKEVFEGACKHCVKLYLTNGIGSKPIIFKLSELRANGSNIGRKVDEWKATIPPVHPHCRCQIFELQEGYLWNEETKRFDLVDPEYKKETQKKRPLFQVMIGDKEYYL